MEKRHTIILLFLILILSCGKQNIIPADTMEDIYYDIYRTDSYIRYEIFISNLPDSTLVYEPIFNKYGYTTEDYKRSNSYYLKDPERYCKIFKNVKLRFQEKDQLLTKLVKYNKRLDTFTRHMDSLPILGDPILKANDLERALYFTFYTLYEKAEIGRPIDLEAGILRPEKKDRAQRKADSLEIEQLTENFRISDSLMRDELHRDADIKDTLLSDSLRIHYLNQKFHEQDSLTRIWMISMIGYDYEIRKEHVRDSLLNLYPDNLFFRFGYCCNAADYVPGYFVQGKTLLDQIKENREEARKREQKEKEALTREKIRMEKNRRRENENKKNQLKPSIKSTGRTREEPFDISRFNRVYKDKVRKK